MSDAPAAAALVPAGAPVAAGGDEAGIWRASGRWTVLSLGPLADALADDAADDEAARAFHAGPPPRVVEGGDVQALDTVGALVLARWATRRQGAAPAVEWRGWSEPHRRLLDRVLQAPPAAAAPPAPARENALARLGRETVELAQETLALLAFLGECAVVLWGELRHLRAFRWRPVLHHVGLTGVSALPIVGMLGLLMGVVVAYQGAGQLARYGANIFVVDLVGLSMLREFAPLVTAIIVAGRSGSAFAAQLGTMAVTEEIDALRALGLSPVAMLVLPRLLALVVVMPLLTLFSDALGLFGGMLMAASRLHVGFTTFLERLPHAVSATTLMLGVGKAPVFAAIVAVVGCHQGLRTAGGADSVGRSTTRSVVQSIFLVIVADAVFSVAFNVLDL